MTRCRGRPQLPVPKSNSLGPPARTPSHAWSLGQSGTPHSCLLLPFRPLAPAGFLWRLQQSKACVLHSLDVQSAFVQRLSLTHTDAPQHDTFAFTQVYV